MKTIRSVHVTVRGVTQGVATLAMFGALGCMAEETPPDGTGGAQGGGAAVAGSTTGGAPAGGSSATGGSAGSSATGGTSATGGAGMTTGGAGGSAGSGAVGGGAGTGAGGSQGGGPAGGSAGAGASGGGQSGGNAGADGGSAGNAGSGAGSAGTSSGGSGGGTASSGCNSTTMPESGRFDIDVDGETREYMLAVPDDYDSSQPYRLIFGWHPWGGSAQQVAGNGNNQYYGLHAQADGAAIFVAPEGQDFGGNGLGWGNQGGKDIAFLEAMLTRFRSELCIDEDRIFSTGFSFGGMMSFAVGCSSTSMMRAIAPQAGNSSVSGCEDGDRPVAVMGFHGDDDTVVTIDGGRNGRDVFVERNGCTTDTMPVTPSWCDGLNSSNQPCSCVSYQGCDAGYPVIWCEFNGGHTPAPSSGETIWNFFSQF
jgi:polyhydroxybutyrate depolymerase